MTEVYMLYAAIKNAVLVVLLICIVHYVIRNAMLESFPVNAPLAGGHEPHPDVTIPQPTQPHVPSMSSGAATAGSKDDSVEDDPEAKELFAWAHSEDPCTEKKFADTPSMKSPDRKGCPPSTQDVRGATVIKEYSDEKGINGGSFFGGLFGYDGTQSSWSSVFDTANSLLPDMPLRPCGQT
jgi:hypothetical protein